ncbi:emerin (Emery-Dreifuss muscular dystrophy) isoform 3-T3 [Odontesthes bonariensis]|uniref:emerin (Emery-Dreifuss muscular dystrophy) isoform X3 n=1 Tax=Odontesthes bonariensis TaxID=219752 RepID=UPI003F587205
MMSLSEKSEAEIQSLLTEFGIKHGPIVDSTRKLYEKKLEQAMAKVTVKQSSDKTFYREEEEEITYVTYHSPRHEVHANTLERRLHYLVETKRQC